MYKTTDNSATIFYGVRMSTAASFEGIRCKHCQTVNRKPVCGRCRTELIEPLFIRGAWQVFRYRKKLSFAAAAAVCAAYLWAPWEILQRPRTYVECKEHAARTARTNAAMYVLISNCSARFPQPP